VGENFNPRSLSNYLMQSNASEMLRGRWGSLWRRWRRCSARQARDHQLGFALRFPRQMADVDHVGRLEGPDQRLDPWHDAKEADPTHEIDRVSLWMITCNGDASRKAENENGKRQGCQDDHENGAEGHVVPESDMKSQQCFHDRPPDLSCGSCVTPCAAA